MMTPSMVIIGIFAIGFLISLLSMIVKLNSSKITERQSNGFPPTAQDIADRKRQARKVPLILMVLFIVAILITVAIHFATPAVKTWISSWKTEQTNTDDTDGTVNETPAGENQPEDQAPADPAAGTEGENPEGTAPAAENPSEDAGDTAEAATEEQKKAETQSFIDYAMAHVGAGMKGLGAIATSGNTTVSGNSTEQPSEEDSQQEETPEEESYVQKGMNGASASWGVLASLFTPDTPNYVYPNMDISELTLKYSALRNYMGVSHYHLTSKKMDGVKKIIAELYGLGKCGDMLDLPPETLEDWPWLYQVAGCVTPVTYDDLKGLDLSDEAVVKELLTNRKKEVWDPKWEAMTEQQRVEQTLLATEVAILNDPRTGKAWLMHYAGIDFVYEAGQADMDNMLSLYEEAYNLDGVDKEHDAYGILCFLEMITEEQFKAGELWRAGVNDLYFNEIGTHLCELLFSADYENIGFKELKSQRNYCLPMAASDVLRLPVEASYQESRLALIREQYGKDGGVVLRDGPNRTDLRPEWFPITVVTKKPPVTTKTNPYLLHIEYRYDNINGAEVDAPHKTQHYAGDHFRVPSPQRDGYNVSIALIEGYPGALNNPMIIEGDMPNGNVHIIIVYTKIPGPTDDDDNGNPPGDNPPGDNPPGDDPTFPKDAGEEPVRNGQDGQTGGGGNSNYTEDGVEADENAENQNREQNQQQQNQNNQQNQNQNQNNQQNQQNQNQNQNNQQNQNQNQNQNNQQNNNQQNETVHEQNTSQKPDSSQTATAGTGTSTSTSTDSQGNQTQTEQKVDLSKENSSTNLSSAPE